MNAILRNNLLVAVAAVFSLQSDSAEAGEGTYMYEVVAVVPHDNYTPMTSFLDLSVTYETIYLGSNSRAARKAYDSVIDFTDPLVSSVWFPGVEDTELIELWLEMNELSAECNSQFGQPFLVDVQVNRWALRSR